MELNISVNRDDDWLVGVSNWPLASTEQGKSFTLRFESDYDADRAVSELLMTYRMLKYYGRDTARSLARRNHYITIQYM